MIISEVGDETGRDRVGNILRIFARNRTAGFSGLTNPVPPAIMALIS